MLCVCARVILVIAEMRDIERTRKAWKFGSSKNTVAEMQRASERASEKQREREREG